MFVQQDFASSDTGSGLSVSTDAMLLMN